jgi:hypothetical protein
MPQFDKITFFNQIFYLFLSFSGFYLIFLGIFLPKLSSVLKVRAKKLQKGCSGSLWFFEEQKIVITSFDIGIEKLSSSFQPCIIFFNKKKPRWFSWTKQFMYSYSFPNHIPHLSSNPASSLVAYNEASFGLPQLDFPYYKSVSATFFYDESITYSVAKFAKDFRFSQLNYLRPKNVKVDKNLTHLGFVHMGGGSYLFNPDLFKGWTIPRLHQ